MSEERVKLGLKPGSLNTCIAMRMPDGKIEPKCIKTAIWYPKTLLQELSTEPPVIGEAALLHAGAIQPLNLGLVETEEGEQQMIDILSSLNLPKGADMVLASPAMTISSGSERLARAVDAVCSPKSILQFSEGVCSAAYILGDVEKLKTMTLLVLNLGSSTFELACVHEASTIHLTAHSDVCGNHVDDKITGRIQNSIGDAMITTNEIRQFKEKASMLDPRTFKVKGQTRNGIVEQDIKDEITAPLNDYVNAICEIIKHEMRTIKPGIRKRALENPLIISGGMANIEYLPERIGEVLSRKINYPVEILSSKKKNNHEAPSYGALMLAEALLKDEVHNV